MELEKLKKDELCCLAKNIGLKGARLCNKPDLISNIRSNYNIYRTIDNGGVPFEVYVGEKQITVFPLFIDWEDEDAEGYYEYCNPVLKLKGYDKLWIGEGNTEDWMEGYIFEDGAAILVQKGDTYYFIGDEVYSFKLDNDNILRFGCPIGNSRVVAPYAIGENFTYDLSLYHHYIIPNEIRENIEPIEQAHHMKVKTKLKVKMIADRM